MTHKTFVVAFAYALFLVSCAEGRGSRTYGEPVLKISDAGQVSGPQLDSEWYRDLQVYWLRHRFYPGEAAAHAERGTAVIRISVKKDGHVDTVRLERSSGSMSLDRAAQSWIIGAQLDPLPNVSENAPAVIDLSVEFNLDHAP